MMTPTILRNGFQGGRLAGFLPALILSLAPALQAQGDCTDANLMGTYGIQSSGLNTTGAQAGPFASIGRFFSYGDGTAAASDTISQAGVISRRAMSVTYAVNPDCTFSAAFTPVLGPAFRVQGSLVDAGKEVMFLLSDPGPAIVGSMKRVGNLAAAPCTNTDLRGTYGLRSSAAGSVASGSSTAPIALVSSVFADGEGNYTETQTASVNGQIVRATYTGAYQVNPDCTGSLILLNPTYGLSTGDFILVDGGREIRLIATNPGQVSSGLATRR